MKRRSVIVIAAIMTTSLFMGCVSIFGPQSGEVVDKATGLPIENVVVIRSWLYGDAGPAGAVHSKAKYVEMTTKQDGRYSFWPDIFFRPIPLFTWTEANPILFYKPGYEVFEAVNPPNVVKLGVLPANRSVRKEELEKAESNIFLYESNLLKQVITEERKAVDALPEYTSGVLYKLSLSRNYLDNIINIAFDSHENLFLASRDYLIKFNKTAYGWDIANPVLTDEFKAPHIQIDNNDNLYIIQSGHLKIWNISSETTQLPKFSKPEEIEARTQFGFGGHKISKKLLNPGQSGFPEHKDFSVVNNGMLLFGSDIYSIEGKKIDALPKIVNEVPGKLPLNPAHCVTAKDGKIYILYSDKDKYHPDFPCHHVLAVFDNNKQGLYSRELSIERPVTGLNIYNNNIYLTGENGYYVLDDKFNVTEHIVLPENIFGKVHLYGIIVDGAGKNILLVDKQYGRILRYVQP